MSSSSTPRLVQTGLDLAISPTIVWHEVEYFRLHDAPGQPSLLAHRPASPLSASSTSPTVGPPNPGAHPRLRRSSRRLSRSKANSRKRPRQFRRRRRRPPSRPRAQPDGTGRGERRFAGGVVRGLRESERNLDVTLGDANPEPPRERLRPDAASGVGLASCRRTTSADDAVCSRPHDSPSRQGNH